MDRLRVAKVDDVFVQQGPSCARGSLHLTQHHLIFKQQAPPQEQERWHAYSLFWLVKRNVPIQSLDGQGRPVPGKRIYPLSFYLRNFKQFSVGFSSEAQATDVFESVRAAIVAESPQQLYAFFYTPDPPLVSSPAGWRIYDAKAEFARQGVGVRSKAWRLCDVNTGYAFCSTYPALMCVPARISDQTIRHAARFRSKERIPALSYLHRSNLATITRSSQPMVGLNNRSAQDERLVEAIFSSHLFADPTSPTAQAAASAFASHQNASLDTHAQTPVVYYGATSTNLIVDARPTTNALANRAKGAGTENMEHYRGCKKVYLGIDNIHVMRDSLHRVTEALRAASAPATFGSEIVASEEIVAADGPARRRSTLITPSAPPLDHLALKRSGWLKHISALLEGTLSIARNIHVNNSHVLIHCSDGWDRTSQLSALAQICLDPYYRTKAGFAVLVEKDWISFGHRFWDRCGHASSEKYFVTADGYGAAAQDDEDSSSDSLNDAPQLDAQAAANAFWGFTKQLRANLAGASAGGGNHARGAHLKEISPVFHQFLDCVWQIMRQFPLRFEFNEQFLLDLYDALYECRFGTFLFNCESERNGFHEGQSTFAPAGSRTYSVWDYVLSPDRADRYASKRFDATLDSDHRREGADMGVLLPNAKDVGFWPTLFGREANDMNRLVQAEAEERKRLQEEERVQREIEASAVAAAAAAAAAAPSAGTGPDQKLAYQPRVRRTAAPQSVSPTPAPLSAAHSQSPPPNDFDFNKMRTMFAGWGARLQDAYANATAAPEDSSTESELPRVVEADHAEQRLRRRDSPLPSVEANPWASLADEHRPLDELPNTLQAVTEARPARVQSQPRPAPVPAPVPAPAPAQSQEEPSNRAYDPLGVL